jgi:hypothetical protein
MSNTRKIKSAKARQREAGGAAVLAAELAEVKRYLQSIADGALMANGLLKEELKRVKGHGET